MQNAGLGRRLGAALYDGLLVFALMSLATLPFIAVRGAQPVEAGALGYRITMLAIAWLFFAIYWSRYGRTLGSQAWRMRVETADGKRPTFGRASVRFLAAILSWLPFGLGFWWQLWDGDRLTWHDRLSGTRLRYYPKGN
ncbi:MAG: RDD family protein [Gammaproteobacteria bacterium]|nr:RDD family protein [Gammaproteobacteria bacterium]MDH4314940.1 RDD family protein [Gammaproteobacteria bacterium]MDH5214179.1 RDD family protein [Gammaproteobacteria bacterium]